MSIKQDQAKAAAEIVADRHFQRGQISGILYGVGGTAPALLILGKQASVSPATTVGYMAAEAGGLTALALGAGCLRRWLMRRRQAAAPRSP